jgi:hypothetical protein
MTKPSSVQVKPGHSQGMARSMSGMLERQHTLGPHISVQREAAGPAIDPRAPSLVRDVIGSPGRPLDASTRASMEPRFGYDFSQVRVHNDERAAESARTVSANAYTAGNHVAFGRGQFAPGTMGGNRLIAHELTHVVQQSRETVDGSPIGNGLYVSHPSDRFEQSASASGSGSDINAPTLSPPARHGETAAPNHIQRDSLGLSTGQGDTSRNANTAQALSAWSGLGSAIGGLTSAFEAHRTANLTQLQAEAAVDPPTAPPLVGGVNSTHVELTPAKAIHTKDWPDKAPPEVQHVTTLEGASGNSETVSKERDGVANKTASGKKPNSTVTSKSVETEETKSFRQPRTTESTSLVEKTTNREADKPDIEKSFKILRLRQGNDNVAEFVATLRHNADGDVTGGTTEDGDITGYQGGSAYPNASVAFRGSAGQPEGDGTATTRILFSGTNVPAREKPPKVGFFGAGFFGGPSFKSDPNYHVQRFSGSVKLTGKGEALKPDLDQMHVKPGQKIPGDGTTTPLLTVDFDDAPSAPVANAAAPRHPDQNDILEKKYRQNPNSGVA